MDQTMDMATHAGAPNQLPRGLTSKSTALDADGTSITSSGEDLTALRAVCSEAEMRFSRSPSVAGLQGQSPDLASVLPAWSPEASAALYNVNGWGCGYFGVSQKGTVTVRPWADEDQAVDLADLVSHLKDQGFATPMMLRFPSISCHRIETLRSAFNAAIERFEYKGAYNPVFPVKSNPDRMLVQSMLDYTRSKGQGIGLEVGSKGELTMALSMMPEDPVVPFDLICNGYKDAHYMELALNARAMGVNAIIVIEQYSELRRALDAAAALGIRPRLGLRAKLATRHGGHWGCTSGDGAKFGLRPREIVSAVNLLAAEGMLDCLALLHFHVGSQITNIRIVKEVMREASFLYAELIKMGAGLAYMDVGGGLAVDYDGSCTDTGASMAYSIQNYANDIVSGIQEVCLQRAIAPPTLLSESGRAVASHSTVLIFDVVTAPDALEEMREEEEEVVESVELDADRPLTKQLRVAAARGKGRFLLTTFKEVLDSMTGEAYSLRESYSDACYIREEALRAFKLGVLSLPERAQVDVMFDATCERMRTLAATHGLPLPEPLAAGASPGAIAACGPAGAGLLLAAPGGPSAGRLGPGGASAPANGLMSPVAAITSSPARRLYHVNFSVFGAAPDAWGIKQVFPILPLARLGEEPRVAATLHDVTCDSDGRIDCFANPRGGEPLDALPLHEVREGESYPLALFMAGVYQEVMGSAHNMFGRMNTAVVWADHGAGGAGVTLTHLRRGETVGEVLARPGHDQAELMQQMEAHACRRVAAGVLTVDDAERAMDCYRRRMAGYTYMV